MSQIIIPISGIGSPDDAWTLDAGASKVAAVAADDGDTSYISGTGGVNATQRFTFSTADIPPVAYIQSVEILGSLKDISFGGGEVEVGFVESASGDETMAVHGPGPGYVSQTIFNDAGPNGNPWTPALLAGSQLFVRNTSGDVRCTYLAVKVTYLAGGGIASDASGTMKYWFEGRPLTTIGNSQGGKMFYWQDGQPFDMYVPITSATANVAVVAPAPVVTATGKDDSAKGSATPPSPAAAGSGSVTPPQYGAHASLFPPQPAASGAGVAAVPQYTAAGEVDAFAGRIFFGDGFDIVNGSGSVTVPQYTGAGAASAPPSVTGSGSAYVPAAGSALAPQQAAAGSGSVTPPQYGAAGAASTPAPDVQASGSQSATAPLRVRLAVTLPRAHVAGATASRQVAGGAPQRHALAASVKTTHTLNDQE